MDESFNQMSTCTPSLIKLLRLKLCVKHCHPAAACTISNPTTKAFVEEKSVTEYGIPPLLFYETTVVSALAPQFQRESSNTEGLQFFQVVHFLSKCSFLIAMHCIDI